jgi:hypothetical protein
MRQSKRRRCGQRVISVVGFGASRVAAAFIVEGFHYTSKYRAFAVVPWRS